MNGNDHKHITHKKNLFIPIIITSFILIVLAIFVIQLVNDYIVKTASVIRTIDQHGELGNLSVALYTDMISKITFWGSISLALIIGILLFSFTSIKTKNRIVFKLAYYDALTDLPNTDYFKSYWNQKRLKEVDLHIRKNIYLINCVNFKLINMTSGYQVGDDILKQIATRLNLHIPGNADLFRLTADRFILIQDTQNQSITIQEMIACISNAFHEPFKHSEGKKTIELNVSVLSSKDLDCDADQVIKKCLIAMDHLKLTNERHYIIYNRDIEEAFYRESLIESELRDLIDGKDPERLYLQYQPQYSLSNNMIVGIESLARFNSKHLGPISPLEFIAIAEKKQLIIQLGRLILREACHYIHKISEYGHSSLRVAVNVSAIQLLDDHFTADFIHIVKETGCAFSQLEIEITESAVMENFEIVNKKLKFLRNLGVIISLDDFGTGYSSLYRLQSLAIDTVKLDKSFVSDLGHHKEVSLITKEIIKMSHIMGLKVVAEGVETELQKLFLSTNSCDYGQGYLFSKPITGVELIAALVPYKMNQSRASI